MSSAGINAINSGPLNIRTYNNSLNNTTYILGNYDIPVSSNLILITSTNGLLTPSNNIYVSSIAVSSLVASTIDVKYANISTLIAVDATISKSYLSTISSIGDDITFTSPVVFDKLVTAPLAHFSTISSIGNDITFTAPIIAPVTHFSTVSSIGDGITFTAPIVLTEPGAETTITSANLTIWGKAAGDPINESFVTTTTYTIQSTISTVNFQLIGAGGNDTFSNPNISTVQLPGYGAYISGTLRVKQGDSLVFTIGQIGSGSSGGTSLIYVSTTGSGSISTLVCIAGAGGGNGYAPDNISTSSGGGHGGGGSGSINIGGLTDYIAKGTLGYDGFSSINGILQSVVDGGQGGQLTTGGSGGGDGLSGQNRLPFGTFTNGGVVLGGQGGLGGAAKGGWGGAGYNGGGGGGSYVSGTISTSAGGGGGATYIATSTLSGFLSNIVCLGGEFLHNNNAAPFGGNYGLPINSGYAFINAYSPNDTLYTNGDIQCRVLRYSQLDPPINSFGGVAALWSLYPAINSVNMNNNAITECGGLEISENGMNVTGSTIITGPAFYYSSINPTSEGTFKIDLDGANLLAYKSSIGGSEATVLQNNGGGRLALGTSNPSIYINGASQGNTYVGIGTATPNEKLTVEGNALFGSSTRGVIRITNFSNNNYIESGLNTVSGSGNKLFFTNYNGYSTIVTVDTSNQRVGVGTINPEYTLDVYDITRISSLLISSISTIHPQITISANNVSTIGNASITGNLTINDTIYTNKLSSNTISSGTISLGILNTDLISSGTIRSGIISSNTISSGTIRSGIISSNTISSGIGLFGTLSSSTYIRGVDTSSISNNSSFPLITNYNGTAGININKGSSNSEIGLEFLSYSTNTTINSMIITNTGRVGINTTTPDEKLDVDGSIKVGSATSGNIRITNTSNGNSYIQFASTASSGQGGILRFAKWGSTDTTMIINTFNDTIGINTTNPSYELDVFGTTRISSLLVSSISTLQPQITISANNVSTVGNASITGNLTINSTNYTDKLSSNIISSGIVTIGTYLSTNVINMTNGQISVLDLVNTNRLSSNIISSGVGYFGTLSSSTYIRGVNTNVLSADTSFPLITNYNGSTGINIIKYDSDNNLGLSFFINSSNTILDTITITSSGKVGIDTSSPAEKLDVDGSIKVGSATSGNIRITNTSNGNSYIQFASTASGGQGGILRFAKWGSTDTTMTINTFNEYVGIGTINPEYTLDINGVLNLQAGTPSTVVDQNVDLVNRVSTYIRLGPAGSGSDFAYLRQIGGSDSMHITLDMHDNANDGNFSIRKVINNGASADSVSTLFNVSTTGMVTANNFACSVFTSSVGLLQYLPLGYMINSGEGIQEAMYYTGEITTKNFLFINTANQFLLGPRVSTIIIDNTGPTVIGSYGNPSYTDWELYTLGSVDVADRYTLTCF